LAARRDGTVTGLKVSTADMGAYLRAGARSYRSRAFMFNGIYKFRSYTSPAPTPSPTRVPTDAYRGAGRPTILCFER
jgi:carbon-monoxide dehydrogenase large subunit